jgi:hypothetical protein
MDETVLAALDEEVLARDEPGLSSSRFASVNRS